MVILAIVFAISFVGWSFFALLFTRMFGTEFYRASLAPIRWCGYRIGSINVRDIATFFVRDRGWLVLLAIAMGLEGYRHPLPLIEQSPSSVPGVTHEPIPMGAEQRALETRR